MPDRPLPGHPLPDHLMTNHPMPEHRWLVMRLEAPLLAFGGVTIDHIGVTRDFPAASMLTGLLANALGFRRTEWKKHQALQDRLVFAVCRDCEKDVGLLTDMQNAKLEKSDKGWTTFGRVEERAGASYGAPHRRKRDFHMDARLTLVLRLNPADIAPTLDDIERALKRPARPVFIGRKPCLPSAPLFDRFANGTNAHAALTSVAPNAPAALRSLWPAGEGPMEGTDVHRIVDLADLRNWRTGLHGGTRTVVEGAIAAGGGTL